jgi:hypothetical protein
MKIVKIVEIMKAIADKVKWEKILFQLTSRTSKQIRDRHLNFLSLNVNRNPFTVEEINLFIQMVDSYINSSTIPWKKISTFFSGRANIFMKNKYDNVKRKILKNIIKLKPDKIS